MAQFSCSSSRDGHQDVRGILLPTAIKLFTSPTRKQRKRQQEPLCSCTFCWSPDSSRLEFNPRVPESPSTNPLRVLSRASRLAASRLYRIIVERLLLSNDNNYQNYGNRKMNSSKSRNFFHFHFRTVFVKLYMYVYRNQRRCRSVASRTPAGEPWISSNQSKVECVFPCACTEASVAAGNGCLQTGLPACLPVCVQFISNCVFCPVSS